MMSFSKPTPPERLLDFAMDSICCFPLKMMSKSASPVRRVIWMFVLFPWIPLTALVWLPLEIVAILWLMFDDAWHGER